MKFNININQYELSKNKDITIQDSAIIDWLFTICGSDSDKVSRSRVDGWTWVSLPHLIDDMPLLRIKTNSGASKLIKRIKTLGYVDTKKDTKERKLYVKPTMKLRDLYFSKKPKSQVLENLSQVPVETAQVPQDTYHNTNTIILNPIQVSVANKEVEKKKTKKQLREESPFIFKEELELLRTNSWIPKKIVFNYFLRKGFTYENRKQFDSAVGRNLKPALQLEGYTSSQIDKTMDYCEKNYKDFGWTLETVVKRISEVANKK